MADSIVGRKEEMTVLGEMLSSSKPEFLAIYGRRRIGKTFLIKQFFKDRKVLFFKVTGLKDGAMSGQIENFTKQISETFYNNAPFSKWKELE